MKVVSVDLARVIWLFNTADLNPTGRSLNQLLAGLIARYKFKKFPNSVTDAVSEGNGLVFSEGEFKIGKGEEIGVALTVYADGMVADTRASTQAAEEFLRDLMQWMGAEQKLLVPTMEEIRVGHFSRLIVRSHSDLESLNPKLREFASFVTSRLSSADGRKRDFKVNSIGLWAEDAGSSGAPGVFRFERKIGFPFADRRYITEGPFTTDALVEVLDKLEQLLA